MRTRPSIEEVLAMAAREMGIDPARIEYGELSIATWISLRMLRARRLVS